MARRRGLGCKWGWKAGAAALELDAKGEEEDGDALAGEECDAVRDCRKVRGRDVVEGNRSLWSIIVFVRSIVRTFKSLYSVERSNSDRISRKPRTFNVTHCCNCT